MAAHFDVTKWANVMSDGGDEKPNGEEGNEEADRGEEETAVRPVGDLLMDDAAGFGEMQD